MNLRILPIWLTFAITESFLLGSAWLQSYHTPPSDGDLTRYVTTIQNSSGKSSIEPKKYLEAYGEVPDKEPPNL